MQDLDVFNASDIPYAVCYQCGAELTKDEVADVIEVFVDINFLSDTVLAPLCEYCVEIR